MSIQIIITGTMFALLAILIRRLSKDDSPDWFKLIVVIMFLGGLLAMVVGALFGIWGSA